MLLVSSQDERSFLKYPDLTLLLKLPNMERVARAICNSLIATRPRLIPLIAN